MIQKKYSSSLPRRFYSLPGSVGTYIPTIVVTVPTEYWGPVTLSQRSPVVLSDEDGRGSGRRDWTRGSRSKVSPLGT